MITLGQQITRNTHTFDFKFKSTAIYRDYFQWSSKTFLNSCIYFHLPRITLKEFVILLILFNVIIFFLGSKKENVPQLPKRNNCRIWKKILFQNIANSLSNKYIFI